MKIDIVEDDSDQGAILRIYDIEQKDIDMLDNAVGSLESHECKGADIIQNASNDTDEFRILHLRVSEERFISYVGGKITWSMPLSDWLYSQTLINAFGTVSKERNGFQWLADEVLGLDGKLYDVLLSESREGLW